jgi:crossover junction endonuclease EME1
MQDNVHWDPISSSAPEAGAGIEQLTAARSRGLPQSNSALFVNLDDSGSDSFLAESDDDLPDLNDVDVAKIRSQMASSTVTSSLAPSRIKNKVSTTAKLSAEEKARNKQLKSAAREAEKEWKKREKELARKQKAAEKLEAAALAEVNKVRTDKKVSTPEMIVDLPSSLDSSIVLQAQTLLQDLDVEHTSWDSPVSNVVKWRRKVNRLFDENVGYWVPQPLRIEKETHALVIVPAAELVDLAFGDNGADLEAHVLNMKMHFPENNIIYLIEGLTPWMRRNRNARNRQFTSAVRNLNSEVAPESSSACLPTGRRRKTKEAPEYMDEDKIENALLELQVLHGALIHHTNAPVETAQWIAVFTQHISTAPYRLRREQVNAGAAFCMEPGQVRTGEDGLDTYVRMLQEVARVTAPIAHGIAAEFPSVSRLVKGLEEQGPLALAEVRKSANKDGALTDRCIGQAVSRRLHKVFLGRDEESVDI